MGRYNIAPDAWNISSIVLMRYPENKSMLADMFNDLTSNKGDSKGGARPDHADPTQTAAIKLAEDAGYQRVKREIAAVEMAIPAFDDIEIEVIKQRFWNHARGCRTPNAYKYIHAPYSERQMHKIVARMIYLVAYNLGELCPL